MDEAPTLAARISQGTSFRPIDELAERCGHYCWLERRLFALTGSRASDREGGDTEAGDTEAGDTEDGDTEDGRPEDWGAEARVLLSEISFRHAFLASRWSERLPVRAGVEKEALVVPPPGPAAAVLDLLEAAPRLLVLKSLAEQFLPVLLDAYTEHLAGASPVSEAPVRAVLDAAIVGGRREILAVRLAVQRLSPPTPADEQVAEFGARFQRALGNSGSVFPAAWAS